MRQAAALTHNSPTKQLVAPWHCGMLPRQENLGLDAQITLWTADFWQPASAAHQLARKPSRKTSGELPRRGAETAASRDPGRDNRRTGGIHSSSSQVFDAPGLLEITSGSFARNTRATRDVDQGGARGEGGTRSLERGLRFEHPSDRGRERGRCSRHRRNSTSWEARCARRRAHSTSRARSEPLRNSQVAVMLTLCASPKIEKARRESTGSFENGRRRANQAGPRLLHPRTTFTSPSPSALKVEQVSGQTWIIFGALGSS